MILPPEVGFDQYQQTGQRFSFVVLMERLVKVVVPSVAFGLFA
jgi:hypothetical protein